MRRHGFTVAALVSALGLSACMGDVGDAGSSLRAVDEGAMTSQTLYMVPDVSAIPLTALELEQEGIDVSAATPVRVEIFDDVAVAWFAPAGEAIISRSSIVAMWRVVERQPIAGELEGGEPGVSSYTQPVTTVTLVIDSTPTTTEEQLADGIDTQVTTRPIEQTIIDFLDRVGTPEEMWYVGRLIGYHPGCI